MFITTIPAINREDGGDSTDGGAQALLGLMIFINAFFLSFETEIVHSTMRETDDILNHPEDPGKVVGIADSKVEPSELIISGKLLQRGFKRGMRARKMGFSA